MKVIPLTQGYVAVIDKVKYKFIKKYTWRVTRSGGKGRKHGEPYAATTIKGKKIYMHRLLMGLPEGLQVDHINKQTLDNRCENLRIVTQSENNRNRIKYKKTHRRK